MDTFGGRTTNAFPKTLLKSLIHFVNMYEQSVGETPNLSDKSSFYNPNLKRINVSKNYIILHLRYMTLLKYFACLDPFQ